MDQNLALSREKHCFELIFATFVHSISLQTQRDKGRPDRLNFKDFFPSGLKFSEIRTCFLNVAFFIFIFLAIFKA